MTREECNYDFCYATNVVIDVITKMNKKSYITNEYYNLFKSYIEDIGHMHEIIPYDEYEKRFGGSFILIELNKNEMLDIATTFLKYN